MMLPWPLTTAKAPPACRATPPFRPTADAPISTLHPCTAAKHTIEEVYYKSSAHLHTLKTLAFVNCLNYLWLLSTCILLLINVLTKTADKLSRLQRLVDTFQTAIQGNTQGQAGGRAINGPQPAGQEPVQDADSCPLQEQQFEEESLLPQQAVAPQWVPAPGLFRRHASRPSSPQ